MKLKPSTKTHTENNKLPDDLILAREHLTQARAALRQAEVALAQADADGSYYGKLFARDKLLHAEKRLVSAEQAERAALEAHRQRLREPFEARIRALVKRQLKEYLLPAADLEREKLAIMAEAQCAGVEVSAEWMFMPLRPEGPLVESQLGHWERCLQRDGRLA